jgi:hypothetical protein
MLGQIQKIKPPTVESVNECLHTWSTLEKYKLQEECLNLLFRELCPRNDDVASVLLKVSALNDFYSTNIFDTHSVAKHIIDIDASERILEGDVTLVNELALVRIGGKQRNFYSFASKYCNHHDPEAFPIYDRYVDKMLNYFRRKDKFAEFRSEDLKRYVDFVKVIKAFRQSYLLDQFSLRQIDIYLWIAGKEAFLRQKGESNAERTDINADKTL